ncbi:MAG: (Fe-S)-binding protein [Nitrococcus sp.]|nr:(Fe-S)-binding protein [Nitrococcus sp.]
MTEAGTPPRVGLFVTCLVDIFRPNIGFASACSLTAAGCTVEVPVRQTCCGQPNCNNGDLAGTRALAEQTIEAFERYDYVVAPSGSCAAQLRKYPALFAHHPRWQRRARELAERTHDILAFLAEIAPLERIRARYLHRVTYHDSCSSLRQLDIKQQPRRLLAHVEGLQLVEMANTEVCCGFGGTFCVKYPEISARMVTDRVNHILASGANTVLGGDLGCLLNIAGRLRRLNKAVHVFHTVEVLANRAHRPGIAEDDNCL